MRSSCERVAGLVFNDWRSRSGQDLSAKRVQGWGDQGTDPRAPERIGASSTTGTGDRTTSHGGGFFFFIFFSRL